MTLSNLLGIPYQVAPHLEDGKVLHFTGGPILIGTHKLSEHREEARRIVREGLADVLEWLGEPVHPPTGEDVLASLKAAAKPESDRWASIFDGMIRQGPPVATATKWEAANADPIADIKAAMKVWSQRAYQPQQPPVWPDWIVRDHPEEFAAWEQRNGFRD